MDVNINPCIFSAVHNERLDEVKTLINHFDMSSSKGYTLLCDAVRNNNTEIIKLLLINGCRVKVENENEYHDAPLHLAVINTNVIIINMLLDKDSNIHVKNRFGMTPLHYAVEQRKIEIIELLLNRGANVNETLEYGITPLHSAAKHEQLEVATVLIKYGADVNAKSITGITPIIYAVEKKDLKMINLLLTNGANVTNLLCTAIQTELIEIIEIVLEHGADVNARDERGITALCLPAFLYNSNVKEEILKMLLSRGANVNSQNNDGTTALHKAAQFKYEKMVEVLLEYNADVNSIANDGRTPLHTAVLSGNAAICKMLLIKGADVNAKTNNESTPLILASRCDYADVVQVLLNRGANINYRDKDGKTALHIASAYKRLKIVLILLKYYSDKNINCNSFNEDNFLRSCKEEIDSMKHEKINKNISFHDMLMKNTNQLAIYARNYNVVQVVYLHYKKFRLYGEMIYSNLIKGIERKELLDKGNNISQVVFKGLPYNCIEKIFSYLSDEELKNLINACNTDIL